jgi:hypothetical protein
MADALAEVKEKELELSTSEAMIAYMPSST